MLAARAGPVKRIELPLAENEVPTSELSPKVESDGSQKKKSGIGLKLQPDSGDVSRLFLLLKGTEQNIIPPGALAGSSKNPKITRVFKTAMATAGGGPALQLCGSQIRCPRQLLLRLPLASASGSHVRSPRTVIHTPRSPPHRRYRHHELLICTGQNCRSCLAGPASAADFSW